MEFERAFDEIIEIDSTEIHDNLDIFSIDEIDKEIKHVLRDDEIGPNKYMNQY